MHILYIHQHFALPSGTTGTRSYEFAKRWVKAGHKVTVITGHYDIGGLTYSKEPVEIDGITVIMAGNRYSNKQGFVKRVWSFFSFILFSIAAGMRLEKPDVIYATSTPLTVGITAIVLKRLRKVQFVFEVRDQWPQVPIELGIIRNSLLKRFLLWLEKRIYLSSSAIVALSPGMAEGIKSIIGDSRPVITVPNCSDTDVFKPDVDGSEIRRKYCWEDKFVLLHCGAMGKANGLDFLVDAAQKLRNDPVIHFVIIGDGSTKSGLEKKTAELGLSNIEFLRSVEKCNLPYYIAACDAALVIFANFPILEHNSANKFFDSISAGKPVLLNYSGWQQKIIEEHNAGLGCHQFDIDEFVEKIKYLKLHPDQRIEMGEKARQLALTNFDRDKLAAEVFKVIELVRRKQT